MAHGNWNQSIRDKMSNVPTASYLTSNHHKAAVTFSKQKQTNLFVH